MAKASDKIITDILNLKIAEKIALRDIKRLFAELGFELVAIEKREVMAHTKNDLIIDLLTEWKTKHGCGLEQAETLKDVMKNHGGDDAVNLIQEAIDKVIPPPPVEPEGLLTDEDATSTSTKERVSPMEH